MELFVYPKKIAISSCLLGDNVKYSGGNNYSFLFSKLLKLDYLKICPEILGGLSTPRVSAEKIDTLVFTKDGIDITSNFIFGAEKTVKKVKENNIDIVIMKSKSPSCGFGQIYDGTFTGKLIKGNGITVELLLENDIKIVSS